MKAMRNENVKLKGQEFNIAAIKVEYVSNKGSKRSPQLWTACGG